MSDQHTCDWCGCTCRATDYDSLRVEVERLTLALHTANSNHEHFEREWYLRGDEVERLRHLLTMARYNGIDGTMGREIDVALAGEKP